MSIVAVVGAGLMGGGIGQVSAQAGWDVRLVDTREQALTSAVETIRSSYARFVGRGRLTEADAEAAVGRISTTTDLEAAVAGVDIVVEAVFERVEAKREIFARLDKACGPDTVLATNTSAIPITSIAAATARPASVVGVHFFSPVPLMALCELVRGYKTSDETLRRARGFAESVGKTCVVVNRDVAGFVTTRLIVALAVEAARLAESGVATPEDIDTACRLGFGHAMGPLETMDLTGVDIMVHAAENIYAETGEHKFFAPEIARRMVAAGDIGRKSGQGWYRHE